MTNVSEKWKPVAAVTMRPLNTLFAGVLRGGGVFRGVLQRKLVDEKLPFRQAVTESLCCFDDSRVLDEFDQYDEMNISSYNVTIE